MKLDAIIYLEQVEPGKFVRYSLEQGTCDHVTCVAGRISGKAGKIDFVTGNFSTKEDTELGVSIWKNLGPRK